MEKNKRSKNKRNNIKDSQETKTFKKVNENKGKRKNNKNLEKKKKIIKRIIIIAIILVIVMAGIGAGLLVGMSSKYAITEEDLMVNYSNSIVYDSEGNIIATLSAKENRKVLTKNEMGPYLPNAFVSIEDKRFYTHNGVDIKRTLGAVTSFVFNRGTSSYGGSTITQQLVKNITDDKDDTGVAGAVRKAKEMIRAYQVENILSKDQILELYMNIIYLGGNIYGVGMASQYYFDKEAADLDLAESAFIAGVTHSPNAYNPFSENPNTEIIKNRPKTVLGEMKKAGYISEEEYNNACTEIDNGLNFKKGSVSNQASYSSHTEALINDIIDQLVTEKGMDEEYAKTYLYGSGLKIYSTEVSSIQSAIEEEYSNSKYQVTVTVSKGENGEAIKETSQSAMVIIDHTTGNVVGAVGALGEKGAMELNRVTQSKRQPGSSIKPIGVYGPALQEGKINAATVYEDKKVTYGSYSPGNSYSGYKGLINMRQAIKVSSNTVAVQVMNDLTPAVSISYLRKMGITSLIDDDENLSLALGGISYGITPLEMAAAYATIANNGTYISPTFYSKVEDNTGKIILEPSQKKTQVFSEQNAYILKQLLMEPTQSGGTATICKISGMDTAAKTGTTNSKKDKWLCGFTPYYTAATWYGYDTPTAIPSGSTSNANIIWKNVMANIHSGLQGATFTQPEGIVTATVCTKSGLLATDSCTSSECSYTEYFVNGTVPKDNCVYHNKVDVCTISGMLAGDHCKQIESKGLTVEELSELTSKGKCNVCKEDAEAPVISLKGTSTVTLYVGETYNEAGATAKDNVDGDLTSRIITTGTVDTNKVGSYTINYTVSDSAGNIGKATRTVKIVKKGEGKDNNINTNINTNTNTNTNTSEEDNSAT